MFPLLRLSSRVKLVQCRVLRQNPKKERSFLCMNAGLSFTASGLVVSKSYLQIHKRKEESWLEFIASAIQETARNASHHVKNERNRVIVGIICANSAVFGLWRLSLNHAKLNVWMWRNFACSYRSVVHEKQYHTLLTSAFSHITLSHFAVNMFMLWEFGPKLIEYKRSVRNPLSALFEDAFGSKNRFGFPEFGMSAQDFLCLYLGAAIASSASSVAYSYLRGALHVQSIGASGAVMAIFTVFCLTHPDDRLALFGLFEGSASDMIKYTTLGNVVGAAYQRKLQIDFAGHLGGQLAGYIGYKAKDRKPYLRK